MLSERIVRALVSVLTMFFVARYLGPEQFGRLSFANSFVAFFSVVALLGLESIVVRDLVRSKGESKEIISTSLMMILFTGMVLFFVLNIIVQFLNIEETDRYLIIVISLFIPLQCCYAMEYYFRAQVQGKLIAKITLTAVLSSNLARLALVAFEGELIWFAWAIVLEIFIHAALFTAAFRKMEGRGLLRAAKVRRALSLFSSSWPILLNAALILAYMRIDQIMLGLMLDAESVGIYAAATRLSEPWAIFIVVFSSALFPWMLEGTADDEKLLSRRTEFILTYSVIFSIFIVILSSLFADEIIDFVYGAKFSDSGQVLRIHIIGLYFSSIGIILGKWVAAHDLQRYTIVRTIAATSINIVLNFILIPRYGATGAASASVVALCINGYAGYVLDRRLWPAFTIGTKALIPHRLWLSKRDLSKTAQ